MSFNLGPGKLPAAPWGSVWLDPEHLLEGECTRRLKDFLTSHKIEFVNPDNEPIDHIGIMLALSELVNEHILTWLPEYVAALRRAEPEGFYIALSRLTLLTLTALNSEE